MSPQPTKGNRSPIPLPLPAGGKVMAKVSMPTSLQPDDEIIIGRRSPDGSSFTFDVKVSHIIEQTLLREYKRPEFRKSTIKIIEEDKDVLITTESVTDSSNVANEDSKPCENPEKSELNHRLSTHSFLYKSLTCGTEKTDESSISEETSERVKPYESTLLQLVHSKPIKDEKSMSIFKPISPIPPCWIERGLTQKDLKRFQTSLDNASLCPHKLPRYRKSRRLANHV